MGGIVRDNGRLILVVMGYGYLETALGKLGVRCAF